MIVQLSDLHLGATGAADPLADARRAVAAVRALAPAPDAVLVTGDLTQHGTREEYAAARELLDGLRAPVHVLPGNHDDRAALRAAFPNAGDPAAPYRWTATCGDLRVVGLDSTRPERADGGGALDAEALAWLDARLAEAPGAPTLVAMHHPPFPIGMPVFDEIGLPPTDRDALAEVVRAHPCVRAVTAGHVHLAATGRVGGVPAVTAPSTWTERAALQLGATRFTPRIEPAGFLVHALVAGELVTHVQPVAGSDHGA